MSPVNDQFIPFGFAFVFGDDASHFYGIGQLQLAAGKLPVAVQIGRVDGRHYCSTLTIASIAADRFRLIVFPERRENPMDWAVSILLPVGIWSGSLLLACPLFLFRTLKHFQLNEELLDFASVDFCVEKWPDPVTHLTQWPALCSSS